MNSNNNNNKRRAGEEDVCSDTTDVVSQFAEAMLCAGYHVSALVTSASQLSLEQRLALAYEARDVSFYVLVYGDDDRRNVIQCVKKTKSAKLIVKPDRPDADAFVSALTSAQYILSENSEFFGVHFS